MIGIRTGEKTNGAANGHIRRKERNVEAGEAIKDRSREPGARGEQKLTAEDIEGLNPVCGRAGICKDDENVGVETDPELGGRYSIGKDLIPELEYESNSSSHIVDGDDWT